MVQTNIPLSRVADYFNLDSNLFQDFAEFGLYPTIVLEGEMSIEAKHIEILKKIISLYSVLGINKEGIEVILKLGRYIATLQEDLRLLKNEIHHLNKVLKDETPEALRRHGRLIEVDD